MRLIRGAPGAGKTALVFREFKEALGRGEAPARIVVPTATMVRHFQHELARDGIVFPPSSVISLSRFIGERAAPAQLAPAGLLRAIARDALDRLQLPEFADVAQTDGMTSTVLDTIVLFENAGATPDQLTGQRKLGAHGKAFAKLWRAIDLKVRESGFSTRTGMLRAAAANLQPTTVWMDGFLHFSPLEAELVSALARCCDLTLTLTDTPGADEMRRLAMSLGAQDRLLHGNSRKPEIVVASAPSMPRAADELARRVLQLHEQGTAFREMGIALRDASLYLPLLRGTFERFGIPARFYFAAPLRRHPVAMFAGGLIASALNGWEFGSLLDVFSANPGWGRSAAFDRLDFNVREAMPGRGAKEFLALCDADIAKRVADCLAIDAWPGERLPAAAWAHRFEHMAETLYRPGTLETPRDFAAVETARSHSAGLQAWVEAVGSVTAFWGADEPVSLAQFWRVASEAVDGAVVQTPDDRRDVVHVMSVYEARQWDVSALLVCGTTDREFPRRNPPNLLFPDHEISALNKAGIAVRKAADLDREEKQLFDSLLTRARRLCVFTWPRHDASGRSVESSRYLLELKASAVGSQACRAAPAVAAPGPGVAGRIAASDLLAALGDQHRQIGLTSLEDMTQCRFRFFAGRTLGLKTRPERPEERLQPKVTGLILHEALEAWLNLNRTGDFVPLFEAAFEKACRERHLPPGYRLEVDRMTFREIARRVTATEQWTPESSQAEVDLTMDFPGGITVKCRVDRIDRMKENDCIIVDYKSGKTTNVEKLVESSAKLQGPLYALAVRERLGLRTIAMMYVAVREDRLFGWGEVPGLDLDLKEMPANWIEDAHARSVERLESFLGGAVRAEPLEPGICRWCDFAQACRVEQTELVKIEHAHGA